MNNEKSIEGLEELNELNETFISDLTSKESFVISWHAGAVLPVFHPEYYNGRIDVEIRKISNNSYGNINFEKDEYQVSDDIVNKLYNYVENNIQKLIELALSQTTEMYVGRFDNLLIKFKSIYISLSELNTTSDEEKIEIAKIKEDFKKIMLINKVANNNSSEKKIYDE